MRLRIRAPPITKPRQLRQQLLSKATDTMPSIPLRRSTSLVPSLRSLWRVIDASWTPKPNVSAPILWHAVAGCVGARSSRSQFRRLLSSDLFWCRQTQWLTFPAWGGEARGGGVGGSGWGENDGDIQAFGRRVGVFVCHRQHISQMRLHQMK